jgi:hypothetical protein
LSHDPEAHMPIRRDLFEDVARRRDLAELEAERARRRVLARAGLLSLFWMLVGLYLLGWSVHTLDYLYGRIFFFGGLIVGNTGIVYVLLAAYRQLEKSGDL